MTWRAFARLILRLVRWRLNRPARPPEPAAVAAAPTCQHASASTGRLAELEARAAQLQARAASGSKGCVAARRELSEVRHAILREAMRPAGV